MIRRIRLFISRRIGFFLPPVGEWQSDNFTYEMRRLTPSGDWERRPMTPCEVEEEMRNRAW